MLCATESPRRPALVCATQIPQVEPKASMTDSDSQSNRELNRRLSEVESLLTYVQRMVDELNAVILEQQGRLAAQEKEIARLRGMFSTLEDSIVEVPRRPEDEKPPHY
jgi:uncharacterized coiled-coil protein SlyX